MADKQLIVEKGSLKLRGAGEWRMLRLTEADVSRVVNYSDNQALMTSISVNGDINSFTVANIRGSMGSGTGFSASNQATFHGWKLLKPDGSPYTLNDHVNISLFMDWSYGHPTFEQAKCNVQMVLGVNNGSTSWSNGKIGAGVKFVDNQNPKCCVFSQGGGFTFDQANSGNKMLISHTWTMPAGIRYPFRIFQYEAFDTDFTETTRRQVNGTSSYNGTSSPDRTEDLYVFFSVGRQSFGAAYDTEDISIRLAAQVTPVTYNSLSAWRPASGS